MHEVRDKVKKDNAERKKAQKFTHRRSSSVTDILTDFATEAIRTFDTDNESYFEAMKTKMKCNNDSMEEPIGQFEPVNGAAKQKVILQNIKATEVKELQQKQVFNTEFPKL